MYVIKGHVLLLNLTSQSHTHLICWQQRKLVVVYDHSRAPDECRKQMWRGNNSGERSGVPGLSAADWCHMPVLQIFMSIWHSE